MGTMSYHTLITTLQIKSSIHHICTNNCIGSIHKWHEHLKHQYSRDFSFNSILLLTTFLWTPPCSARFFACYSSSITTNIRSNCWSNLLLLYLLSSPWKPSIRKLSVTFCSFWMMPSSIIMLILAQETTTSYGRNTDKRNSCMV